MKNAQPNFETLKTLFYRNFEGKATTDMHVLFEQIRAKMLLPSFFSRLREFKADFNKWLDGIDIRQSAVLIDILREQRATVPAWMVRREFVIDYNKHGMLDLIRHSHDQIDNTCTHCHKNSCIGQECLDN